MSATCKAQICSPNQPTCNGNSTATCNSDGSGYATTGASCGTQYCVSGVCQNALFQEDWEDGDYNGWTIGNDATYTVRGVTTAQAANSTAHSLIQTGGSTHQQGLYRTLPNLKPTYVSWWVMPTTTTSYPGYFILTSGGSMSNYLFYAYFQSSGTITTSNSTTTPYVANTWYHFEMRNINWSAHTFDWYINGALIYPGHTFSGSYSSIGRIDLYNFNSGTAYWDEITFQ